MGFDTLSVFAAITPNPHHLRGLYGYLSATIGDGVLLPVAGYALVRAVEHTSARGRSRWPTAIGGLTGATAGVALQCVWLLDPHPQLNWTLPAPGTFNAAGWYHAAFVVLIGTGFAGLTGRFVANVRTSRLRLRQIAGALAVLTALSASFSVLLVVDNLGSFDRLASLVSVVTALLTIILLLALVGLLSLRRR